MGRRGLQLLLTIALLAGASLAGYSGGVTTSAAPTAGNDWTRYLGGPTSSGFNNETIITPTNAALLKAKPGWPVQTPNGAVISTQPIVANGLVYYGAWDGYEHAVPLSGGHDAWATNLGKADSAECGTVGVASTGTVVSMNVGGATSVLFVGGGGTGVGGNAADMYALDALTGRILWQTPLGAFPNNFMWSSPVVYTYTAPDGSTGTSVYQGVSALGDCPLVQGKVVQLDAVTGQVQHVFNVVPDGCLGGSVWGSPTIDPSDGSVYVATGNPDQCSSPETYAYALLKLRASDLSLLDYWSVPPAEQFEDVDFGGTPTLFTGTVTPAGLRRPLIGLVNKNGTYYVFDRNHLSAGPVARLKAADDPITCGSACPEGVVSVAPSAWDGTNVYVGGITITIKGVQYQGSLTAWNPNNFSKPVWQDGLTQGHVIAAVMSTPGLVVVGAGSTIIVARSSDGTILFMGRIASITAKNPPFFWGAPTISHGVLYEGDTNAVVHAYSVLGQ